MKRKLVKVKAVRRLVQLVRLMNVYFRTQDAGREVRRVTVEEEGFLQCWQ